MALSHALNDDLGYYDCALAADLGRAGYERCASLATAMPHEPAAEDEVGAEAGVVPNEQDLAPGGAFAAHECAAKCTREAPACVGFGLLDGGAAYGGPRCFLHAWLDGPTTEDGASRVCVRV